MKLHARLSSVSGPLVSEVGDSKRRWTTRTAILLQLEDGEGAVGQGEASPLPGYSSDNLDRARASLRAISWDRLDLGGDGESIRETLERVVGLVDPTCPSARFAVETAALDLIAQRRGEPLHRLLREERGSFGSDRESVPLAAMLPMTDLDSALAAVDAREREGIRTFKAKVGRHLDRELSILGEVRHLRRGVRLRIDANQSLAEQDVQGVLSRLATLDPEYVEEPLPFDALLRMAPSPVPIALDESLQSRDAELWAARAMDAGRAQFLVLKPAALGGISRCSRLAALGARRGVASSVSHLYDGPVARAASAELALSIANPAAAGLASHPGLEIWPGADSPAFGARGLERHDVPGLGLAPMELEG